MTFRNVYKFKKQLVKSRLVWSTTLSILLTMNREIISMFVIAHNWSTFQKLQAAEKRNSWIKCQPMCQKM